MPDLSRDVQRIGAKVIEGECSPEHIIGFWDWLLSEVDEMRANQQHKEAA